VKAKLTLAERTYHCGACGLVIDRDRNAAINLARLSEHAAGVEGRPAGSGPVAGRGASQKTPPGGAGGGETSTRHQAALGKTGTAPPQGEAA
jgi:putative transposase